MGIRMYTKSLTHRWTVLNTLGTKEYHFNTNTKYSEQKMDWVEELNQSSKCAAYYSSGRRTLGPIAKISMKSHINFYFLSIA